MLLLSRDLLAPTALAFVFVFVHVRMRRAHRRQLQSDADLRERAATARLESMLDDLRGRARSQHPYRSSYCEHCGRGTP